tara:strand:- start:776 stop:1063 length:288 start_codon:yes stop_codon:yes gene_type:complete
MTASTHETNRGKFCQRHILFVMTLSQNRWWTVTQLSEKFGMSTKTIRRDLIALQDAGLPLIKQRTDTASYGYSANQYKLMPQWGEKFLTRAGLKY